MNECKHKISSMWQYGKYHYWCAKCGEMLAEDKVMEIREKNIKEWIDKINNEIELPQSRLEILNYD